jgi:hypothetical protein
MPASAPERAMLSTTARGTFMPAYRAASGLAPAVRMEKPSVVRLSPQPTSAASASAKTKPQCTRSPSRSGGMRALSATRRVRAMTLPGVGSFIGPLSRKLTALSAM